MDIMETGINIAGRDASFQISQGFRSKPIYHVTLSEAKSLCCYSKFLRFDHFVPTSHGKMTSEIPNKRANYTAKQAINV